ncbi:HlyD family secretion protein [Granulicella tundricola]|uniref:Secretion protein HlyD family protein n=1 Tax=Granulicella tundricola (strain ATCC BAA-1859 / DSM 23138 / MP5ACTX9) TaxID=1198114 RepID=E8X752_GRATM|nr:HlyD family secretion protein [Granulicella tundricola]ADW71286.1 secretion protein HlyD family protein [Granulicella tundricola MP5ACTX9]
MADQQPPELPQLPQIPTDHLLPSEAGESHPMMDAALSTGHSAGHIAEPHADLALRMLYDEQTRLRTELNDLRRKSEEKKDDKKKGEKKDDQVGDDKEEEEGGDDKKDGEKKDGDDKKEEKPPLKERVHEVEKKTKGWTRQHPIATVAIIAGVIILIIATILLVHYLDSYESTDDAFIDGHTDPISFRISGIVSKVYVENTFRVKKGQLLVELDDRDNQVAREQAAANYAQSQAAVRAQSPNVGITATDQNTQVISRDYNVINNEAQVAQAEERYRSALADLRQAEAQEGNAIREEERYGMLVVKEEVTREQYDQRATERRTQAEVVASRRNSAEAAHKSVTQAEAQLEIAKQQARQARQDTPRQIQMQREMLAQRKASELAAKAQSDQSQLNLEYTRIYAPEDGIIGDKQVQVATQVAPGQELFALTQTNDIWITANFKETEIRRMHPGQGVTIYVDALSQKFQGYVEALPGGTGAVYSLLPPENATGNYVKVVQRLPVRIRINAGQDGAQRLAPGMSVEPKVWVNH